MPAGHQYQHHAYQLRTAKDLHPMDPREHNQKIFKMGLQKEGFFNTLARNKRSQNLEIRVVPLLEFLYICFLGEQKITK